MNNLEKLNVQKLNGKELRAVNGGRKPVLAGSWSFDLGIGEAIGEIIYETWFI